MSTDGDGFSAGSERWRLAAAVSNAIVGLHGEYYGRGAGRAHTVMGADYVICFLEDIYTPVERTLIDAGRFDAVQETRTLFQESVREKSSTRSRSSPVAGSSASSRKCTSIPTSSW